MESSTSFSSLSELQGEASEHNRCPHAVYSVEIMSCLPVVVMCPHTLIVCSSGTCQRAAWRQLGTGQAIFYHFKIAIMYGYVSGRLESAWEQYLADLCSGVIPPLLWLWRPPFAGKKIRREGKGLARDWHQRPQGPLIKAF